MASVKSDRPFAIRQLVTSGNHFNGTEPAGVPTAVEQVFKFAAEAAGGKFDLSSVKYDIFEGGGMYEVVQIELKMGGQTSWTVSKLNDDGVAVVMLSGTNETSKSLNIVDRLLIHKLESVQIATAGGTPAGVFSATVWFQRYKGL